MICFHVGILETRRLVTLWRGFRRKKICNQIAFQKEQI
jgi:hypothetical protein